MKDIIILVREEEEELISKVKQICVDATELKDNNFDGDSSLIALLVTLTPIIVTQLGEVIKTLIQNPSKGKIKVNGIEIEGFTYEETIKLLDRISAQNGENKR